jgi:hypothetical protein
MYRKGPQLLVSPRVSEITGLTLNVHRDSPNYRWERRVPELPYKERNSIAMQYLSLQLSPDLEIRMCHSVLTTNHLLLTYKVELDTDRGIVIHRRENVDQAIQEQSNFRWNTCMVQTS